LPTRLIKTSSPRALHLNQVSVLIELLIPSAEFTSDQSILFMNWLRRSKNMLGNHARMTIADIRASLMVPSHSMGRHFRATKFNPKVPRSQIRRRLSTQRWTIYWPSRTIGSSTECRSAHILFTFTCQCWSSCRVVSHYSSRTLSLGMQW
jgi:hypothetical protein